MMFLNIYILEKRKSFKLHALITYRFLCGFKFGKTKVRWMSHEITKATRKITLIISPTSINNFISYIKTPRRIKSNSVDETLM